MAEFSNRDVTNPMDLSPEDNVEDIRTEPTPGRPTPEDLGAGDPNLEDVFANMDSRYAMTRIIFQRAKHIQEGHESLIDSDKHKPISMALMEFYNGMLEYTFDSEEVETNLAHAEEIEKTPDVDFSSDS